MESTSVESRPKGKGSLENPEVYENVPGHVIPVLEREFDDFDNESERFLGGDIDETEFIGFRLKQGVYGQRQADVQMIRVKLPMGGITPEQLEAFGEVAERFAPLRKGHITTRQNIQYHHVPLDEVPQMLRDLADAGTTVLIVEQDVTQALAVADHVTCLLTGSVSLEGRPAELDQEEIRRTYFGM